MTVEAVPTKDDMGQPLEPERVKSMHITMQTLGRIAIIGGTLLVAIVNMAVFAGVDQLAENEKLDAYARVYAYSLVIPIISVTGVLLAFIQQKIKLRTLTANGVPTEEAKLSIAPKQDNISPNWTILLGSAVFVVFFIVCFFWDYMRFFLIIWKNTQQAQRFGWFLQLRSVYQYF